MKASNDEMHEVSKGEVDEEKRLPGARPANSKILIPFKGGLETVAAMIAAGMDELFKVFINGAS
jgi:hypothetical protein